MSFLRYYGYRKLLFLLLAYPISGLMMFLFAGWPPSDYAMWPQQAQASVALTSSGLWDIAWVTWLWGLLRPLQGVDPQAVYFLGPFMLICVALWGIPGLWELLRGIKLAIDGGPTAAWHIGWLVFWIAGLPILTSASVAAYPDIVEYCKAEPTVRRHFIAGHGHAAGWAGPHTIARKVKSLPATPPPFVGYTSEEFYLGRTLFEDSYVGGQDLWLPENHFVSLAGTGAGKSICTIYPIGCTYAGSALIVSPKPELADVLTGRRTDVSLFEHNDHPFKRLGIDVRGHTQCRYHLRGGRVMTLDPHQQGYYLSKKHTILSEINPRNDLARALIFAVASGIVPENSEAREPFFRDAARSALASGIGGVMCRYPRPNHTLPFVADKLLGVDPHTGRADPQLARDFLIECAQIGDMGGFIRAGAVQLLDMGEQTFGSVQAELLNHLRFINDPMMRRHLEGPSDFSYTEMGEDYPLTVFIIPPRLAAQESMSFLRMHAELALQLQIHKRNRPRVPNWICLDEYSRYPMDTVASQVVILREARARLHLVAQGIATLNKAMGKHGVGELLSCSDLQCYGIKDTDLESLEFIAKALGKYTCRRGGRFRGRPVSESIYDLMTPAEIAVQLRKTNPLQIVFPASSAPMKLERLAHKPVVTAEGGRFRGLPLAGHFDDDLSQFTIGNRSA